MPASEQGMPVAPSVKGGGPYWTIERLRELLAERTCGDHDRMCCAEAALEATGLSDWGDLIRRAWGAV